MGSDFKCVFDRKALPTNERMSTKESLNHEVLEALTSGFRNITQLR